MSKSSLLCVRRGLLRVAPVILVMLGLFAARPASAGPIVASVFACGAALCFQGGATGTLTGVFPSGAALDISRFAVPMGSGETESFFAHILFSDGTVSGDAAIVVNYSTSPFGPVFAEDTLSLTSGTFSLAAGKITANLSGTGYFCDVLCELTGAPGQTGSASLSVGASPTPEPSTYMLWGTAGLLGLGIWARRRFRATEGAT
jgi:MYXO-CTERM domain-containing protein